MAINYSYPNAGGFDLQTQGGAGGGVGAPSLTDLTGFIQQMALRKMAQQEQDRNRAMQLQDQALHEHEEDRQNAQRSINPADDLRMKNLAEEDAIAKSQAMRQPAPQKLATGYSALGQMNGPSFTGPDVGAMNAYQRTDYLPNSSTADPLKDAQANAVNAGVGASQEDEYQKELARRSLMSSLGNGR